MEFDFNENHENLKPLFDYNKPYWIMEKKVFTQYT